MKYFKTLSILLFSSVLFFYSCNDSSKTTKQDVSDSVEVVDSTVAPVKATTPNPVNAEPAQNEIGVWHYTCSKGCPGGAGSASKCENCGGVLAHNTRYHADANSTPSSSSPFANPPASTATPTPEPSQNTAGVWHYTCGKGCAGGAGAAGSCSTCGGALAHNSAYHQ